MSHSGPLLVGGGSFGLHESLKMIEEESLECDRVNEIKGNHNKTKNERVGVAGRRATGEIKRRRGDCEQDKLTNDRLLRPQHATLKI